MNHPARLVFAASAAMMVMAPWPGSVAAAEIESAALELAQVETSSQVQDARWLRYPESYVLQVVLDSTKYKLREANADADAAAMATIRETPQAAAPDRPSFFVSRTIASLGADPWIACSRPLGLVDGRRPGQPSVAPQPPERSFMNQSFPPRYKERRIDVWLLKADGTQILPASYSCDAGPVPTLRQAAAPVEVSYQYPLAQAAQAVAAAIRIDDSYYIEKLQRPPPATPAAQ